jgi:N-acylneuraminate cytidylyltransferase
MWTLKIENECLVPFMNEHGIGVRTQELPTAYAMNGSFYLISPEEFRITRSFIGSKSIPLMIDSQKESLDVDTEWDFKIANMIVESGS